MSLTVDDKSFKALIDKFDSLGNITQKEIGKKAIKAGLKVVIEEQKQIAPKSDKTLDHQAQYLDIANIKTYKSGSIWGKCGIHKKNFEKTKGLYFQNYGYTLKSGKRVTVNVGWMTKAFEKVKGKADDEIRKILEDEIRRLL